MAFTDELPHFNSVAHSSDTSHVHTIGSNNVAARRFALMAMVSDNEGGAEDTTLHASVADSQGNTWVKAKEASGRGGAAADTGVTVSLWRSIITTELVSTVDTVTLTLSTAKVARASRIISFAAAGTPQQDGAWAQFGASDTPSLTSGTISTAPRLWVAVYGHEFGTTLSFTEDADYSSSGSFACDNTGSGDHIRGFLATRIATIAQDTYAVSTTTAVDEVIVLAAFRDVTAGGSSIAAISAYYRMMGMR